MRLDKIASAETVGLSGKRGSAWKHSVADTKQKATIDLGVGSAVAFLADCEELVAIRFGCFYVLSPWLLPKKRLELGNIYVNGFADKGVGVKSVFMFFAPDCLSANYGHIGKNIVEFPQYMLKKLPRKNFLFPIDGRQRT